MILLFGALPAYYLVKINFSSSFSRILVIYTKQQLLLNLVLSTQTKQWLITSVRKVVSFLAWSIIPFLFPWIISQQNLVVFQFVTGLLSKLSFVIFYLCHVLPLGTRKHSFEVQKSKLFEFILSKGLLILTQMLTG